MYEFTFNFKFLGEQEEGYSFTIRAKNLKRAVQVWTGYVQSAQNMIVLTSIERNGNDITS